MDAIEVVAWIVVAALLVLVVAFAVGWLRMGPGTGREPTGPSGNVRVLVLFGGFALILLVGFAAVYWIGQP